MGKPCRIKAGDRFGRLVVVDASLPRESLCDCDCGTRLLKVLDKKLLHKRVTSCGCATSTAEGRARLERDWGKIVQLAELRRAGIVRAEIMARMGIEDKVAYESLRKRAAKCGLLPVRSHDTPPPNSSAARMRAFRRRQAAREGRLEEAPDATAAAERLLSLPSPRLMRQLACAPRDELRLLERIAPETYAAALQGGWLR
jgi:hypothetical protein